MKKQFSLTLILFCIFYFQLSAQTLTDSLVAYYPFSGNANDLSGNGNNGTLHGPIPTADRFGNAGSAYLFGVNNDTILYTSNSGFKPTTFPISVSAWIKSNCFQSTGIIFHNDFGQDVYSGVLLCIAMPGGQLDISYGDGGTTNPTSRRTKLGTHNVNDNQWHFVAGVIRSATDMDLWIDCEYETGSYSGTGGPIAYTNNPGCSGEENDVVGDTYYGGAVDDIRLYHRELTQSDFETLMITPTDYLTPTLNLGPNITTCDYNSVTLSPNGYTTYLWSTGETSSSIVVDSSGIGDATTSILLTVEKGFGCSTSDSVKITFIDCSEGSGEGINEINSFSGMLLSPNPATDFSEISFSSEMLRSITVTDLAGRTIISNPIESKAKYRIDLSALSEGIYLFTVIDGAGNSISKSLVVNR